MHGRSGKSLLVLRSVRFIPLLFHATLLPALIHQVHELGGTPGVILPDCEEVLELTIEDDWAEVVIASDGVWDVVHAEEMPMVGGAVVLRRCCCSCCCVLDAAPSVVVLTCHCTAVDVSSNVGSISRIRVPRFSAGRSFVRCFFSSFLERRRLQLKPNTRLTFGSTTLAADCIACATFQWGICLLFWKSSATVSNPRTYFLVDVVLVQVMVVAHFAAGMSSTNVCGNACSSFSVCVYMFLRWDMPR